MKIVGFSCLFLGFFLVFSKMRWLEGIKRLFQRTQMGLEDAARQRSLANRQNLMRIQKENSLLFLLEQELNYTGLRVYFPFLGVENWIVGSAAAGLAVFLGVWAVTKSGAAAAAALAGVYFGEYIGMRFCRARANKAVNDNLLKLLDFLGSYSITAGEITGIFQQISRYMEEPLRSALEECCYEAQLTGDVNLALLSMAEKVEHPKLKELARNLEISIRYCADFTTLVNSSRKNMREYLRSIEERKGMLREGMLNMLLLLGLSLFVLVTVDRLIAASVWELLLHTMPGRISIGVMAVIFLLFVGKINKMQS